MLGLWKHEHMVIGGIDRGQAHCWLSCSSALCQMASLGSPHAPVRAEVGLYPKPTTQRSTTQHHGHARLARSVGVGLTHRPMVSTEVLPQPPQLARCP